MLHIGIYLFLGSYLLILANVIKDEFRKFIHGQRIRLNISKQPSLHILTPVIQL